MLQTGAITESKITKFFGFVKKEEPAENLACLEELKKRLKQSAVELNAAMDGFNNATDPKIIDVYIYKIQSEQMNYDKILSEIKTVFEKNK